MGRRIPSKDRDRTIPRVPYRYDLFVSYRRYFELDGVFVDTDAGAWVKQVFYPRLVRRWNEVRPNGKVFLDEKAIPKGAHWPTYLKEALRDSRCLLPVWNRPYFDSRWCLAEWHSMQERETLLRIDRARLPGLVVPVVFFDGDTFPEPAKDTQHHDFHELSDLTPDHLGHPAEMRFRERMRVELVPSLVKAVEAAPPWQDDFPFAPIEAADIERPVPFLGMTPGGMAL